MSTSPTPSGESPQQPPQENGSEPRREVLPTLFGQNSGLYEVHKGSFVLSFLLNAGALALLLWTATWTATHAPEVKKAVELTFNIPSSVLPQAKDVSGGGGGGGSHDVRPATKGALPRIARTQIAPPTAVPPTQQPKLAVEPTVVAPPELKLPQTGPIGDPMSNVVASVPSNGTGIGGGIGSGSGGGVGSGSGPGVGPGHGGGFGGGAYHVGGGVSGPVPIFQPKPEYSDEGRRNKIQGTVLLRAVVGADGNVTNLAVLRSLGMGLDEKAMETVRTWRFKPGTKDGQPVPVEVAIEVGFHLY